MNSYAEKLSLFSEGIQAILKNTAVNVDPDIFFNITIKIYEEAFSDGGMKEAAFEVKEELEELENTELDIAITGETGSGKSSLINALRGMKAEDDGAAPVGVTEMTLDPKFYLHPNYPKMKFWDLPGIGSPHFSPDSYLKKVDFQRYDFFIIVGSERFRSNLINLAQAIQKMEKKCYFVRSKVDSDLYNMERSYPNTFNAEEVLEMMRDDFKKQLEKCFRNTIPQVFLISSWDLGKYDFPRLVETLEKDLPSLKRHAFLLSLPMFSPEFTEKKKSALKSHLWKISLVSAGINAIPIPDLPLACDTALLLGSMVAFYKRFELDDGSLARLARLARKPVEELKAVMKSPQEKEINRDLVIKEITNYTKEFFPPSLVRSLVAAGVSFVITYWMLLSFLDNLAEDAERVRKKALEPIAPGRHGT
ncbi:interferon-inducible GTPase 5-like [Podarcis raffonei]|uniref:interferon-inducible GTPase 5-like n=1 Tax=Podarcis raffonei TaxID=65483 RepID=UPI0023291ABC|nr:interferon-inducible GTPase 5-like [Podarcis raffonei]